MREQYRWVMGLARSRRQAQQRNDGKQDTMDQLARPLDQAPVAQLVSRNGGHFTRHSQIPAGQRLIGPGRRVNEAELHDTSAVSHN